MRVMENGNPACSDKQEACPLCLPRGVRGGLGDPALPVAKRDLPSEASQPLSNPARMAGSLQIKAREIDCFKYCDSNRKFYINLSI